jgi:D-arabinitol dehydrogenase (NADP+)
MPAANGTTNGATAKFVIPTEMKAIRYNKIKDFSLVTMPVPEPKAHEILIKGA